MNKIKFIPFLHIHPELKIEMVREFERFYDDQNYILGPGLEKFEIEYSNFNQVNYAIGVGNGHDALLIALKCLDIGPGDEVIIPALTFIASALAVINVGATPILVDIDEHSFCIKPEEIDLKISNNTRAIVPVHLYGNPCDMGAIQSTAQKFNLHIIEDNAQAQGSEYKGQKTGGIGIVNATSFYPTKNIGAFGDGGLITTNSKELAGKAKTLRNYGKSSDTHYTKNGINSRLDELQARLLLIKLKYLDSWNNERIGIAEKFASELTDIGDIQLQKTNSDCRNVRHIFPILTQKRDELRIFLHSKGIDTLIHYEKPIHFYEILLSNGFEKGDFPIAEKVCETELSLPIYPGLKEEEIIYIIQQVKNFYSNS